MPDTTLRPRQRARYVGCANPADDATVLPLSVIARGWLNDSKGPLCAYCGARPPRDANAIAHHRKECH